MTLYKQILISILLIGATLIVFGQITDHGFINHDDQAYVSENPIVQKGLTTEGFKWAFTNTRQGHWHPLTWLSHMTDCQLFGLDAGLHHGVSLFLHAVNVLLLFYLLFRMTGTLYKSGFVACIFAIHPLNIEAVASLASRKDLLSCFLLFCTMLAYLYYAKKRSLARYCMVFCLFVLGLAAKVVLVTVPTLLLLLDFWPLQRMRSGLCSGKNIKKTESTGGTDPGGQQGNTKLSFRILISEKILLLIPLIAAFPAAIFFMQSRYDQSMRLLELLPGKYHIGNALTAYIIYLKRIIWPFPSVFPYPFRPAVPDWQLYGSIVVLTVITVAVFFKRRTQPFLLTGWCWFIITLLPMIGLLKIGPQAIADRYAYIPLIGIVVILVWGTEQLGKQLISKKGVAVFGVIALFPLLFISHNLTSLWKDSETLFRHSVSVTPDNPMAHFALGYSLEKKGRAKEAILHYQEALIYSPGYFQVHNNLANLLVLQGKHQEAVNHYRQVVQAKPSAPAGHINLANTLTLLGNQDEAIEHYTKALVINPEDADAHMNIGVLYMQQNKLDQAVDHYQKSFDLKPDMEKTLYNLGVARYQQGKVEEAIQDFKKAIKANPHFFGAHFNLGIILFNQMNLAEAALHLEEAVKIRPGFEQAHYQLVLIYKRMGNEKLARHHFEIMRQLRDTPQKKDD